MDPPNPTGRKQADRAAPLQTGATLAEKGRITEATGAQAWTHRAREWSIQSQKTVPSSPNLKELALLGRIRVFFSGPCFTDSLSQSIA